MVFPSVGDLTAVFVGCCIASVFYGITSLQTFLYFSNAQDDSRFRKCVFGFLWILDSIHTVFIIYLVYYFSIFGPVHHIPYAPDWRSSVVIITSNFSDTVIRLMFLHRIWLLTERKWLAILPIGAITLATAGLGIGDDSFFNRTIAVADHGSLVYGSIMPSFTFATLGSISWLLYATLSSALLVDFMLACTLCYLFHRMRSGFERSDSTLIKLMVYTINSGLFTSIVAGATLVTYALMPSSYIFMSVFFVMGKATLNSLLAATNARAHLREKMYGEPRSSGKNVYLLPSSFQRSTVASFAASTGTVAELSTFEAQLGQQSIVGIAI
ncbi:hypothetical protein BDW22DRAFT_1432484 [Trametopsis cervina]|nr:hypothetical protein BDW22DRAFT_1432484 [Trametopsis cervina]